MIVFFPVLLALLGKADDEELAVRLKRHDPRAMADLYDRYGRLAYSLIFRVVRDTGVAEDLVHETILRVWNRVHAYDAEKGALGPWVLTVARNRAIDYLRSTDGRMAKNALELDALEQPAAFADMERGAPSPAGLFQSDANGSAMHLYLGPVEPGAAVAVTVEPEAGSPAPPSTPIIVIG